ncbi:MAG: hypothetical protein LBD49_02225 [Oscillospiraceae bacterium]|jgi:hypothetical protein|nr:hypothetical protein [Oscillospiraceae bacterium]
MNRERLKKVFWGAVLCMFLMSLSFLFMPYASAAALRVSGAWFWATLLAGYGLFTAADRGRKKLTAKRKKKTPKARPGIARVFANGWARAADIACAASAAGFLSVMLAAPRSRAAYPLLSTVVFTAHMHCVLNGENFRFFTTAEKSGKKGKKGAAKR